MKEREKQLELFRGTSIDNHQKNKNFESERHARDFSRVELQSLSSSLGTANSQTRGCAWPPNNYKEKLTYKLSLHILRSSNMSTNFSDLTWNKLHATPATWTCLISFFHSSLRLFFFAPKPKNVSERLSHTFLIALLHSSSIIVDWETVESSRVMIFLLSSWFWLFFFSFFPPLLSTEERSQEEMKRHESKVLS